jgi:hypothetical protein
MLDREQISAILKRQCWIWTKATFGNGYGHIRTGGPSGHKDHSAHRWAYEQAYGPITVSATTHTTFA